MVGRWSLSQAFRLVLVTSLAGCASELVIDEQAGPTQAAEQALTEETVTLAVSQDSSVLLSTPNKNYGSASALDVNRALLMVTQSAIAGALGPSDYLVSASLKLTMVDSPDRPRALPRNVTVHRLLKSWSESGATWNCAVDSNTANSAPNCSGAAAWQMIAGDGTFAPATSATVVPANRTGSIAFDVTADVRAFLAGTSANNGWMIKSPLPGEFVDFGSREGGAPAQLILSVRRCSAALCDDGNACTTDSCDATASCVHAAAPSTTACDDGNGCTSGDHCAASACVSGTPVVCQGPDLCDPGVCVPATGACTTVAMCSLYGVGTIPGTDVDGLDLTPAVLEEGSPNNRVSAFGSAIAYTGVDDLYIATPDRGPANGATSFTDRYYLISVSLAGGAVTPSIVGGATLNQAPGVPFTGLNTGFDATNSPASRRLDPEGVRVSPSGTFFVSDEYGPFLYEFAASGDRIRALELPARFLIAHPGVEGAELPPANTSGRQSNRGMEGLAITPDGSKLYGMMQNALIQDGALSGSTRVGLNNRILEIDTTTGATRELVYVLDKGSYGTNELVAVNDHQFVVIERDGNPGTAAVFKKLYFIDASGASDVSGIDALPSSGLPAGVVPVTKKLLLDLLSPQFGLAGASFPEKIEGLAFGPDRVDGKHVLVVTNDNDGISANGNNFYVFTIDPSVLPGFVAEQASFPAACKGVSCPSQGTCHRAGICNPASSQCGDPLEPSGTSCGNGQVCDGAGSCVSCLLASECPGVDSECSARTCSSGACGIDYAPAGTLCSTDGTCDGAGRCVAAVHVVINEIESSTTPSGSPDWVEIYNQAAVPADLSGFIFKDNDDTHAAVLPAGTVIAAGGYLVLEENAQFTFGLGAADSARLFAPGGATLIDSYSWTVHATTTYGRCPNGSGPFTTTATTNGTKGAANACGCSAASECPGVADACRAPSCASGTCGFSFAPAGTACATNAICDGAGACVATQVDVVINEIESSTTPTGSPDWIEIYNRGPATADLSGYIFRDNDDTHAAVIPAGTLIPPGGYLVLEELTAFTFGLGSGDSARLFAPDGTTVVDSFTWTAHATTTYGRCPNGTGGFVTTATTSGTKGTTNACP